MKKKKLIFVLGIRPDIIRAVLIMRFLNYFCLVWATLF